MIDPSSGIGNPSFFKRTGGVAKNQLQQRLAPVQQDELSRLFEEATRVVDHEIQYLMDELKKQQPSQLSTTSTTSQEASAQESVASQIATLMNEVEIRKKNTKKTPFEQTMMMLETLEDELDTCALPPHLQEVFNRFFDNMGRIRRLKKRLEQLQKEEEQLADYLKRNPPSPSSKKVSS